MDSGALGKIGFARTWYMSNGGYVQQAPPGFEKKPEGLRISTHFYNDEHEVDSCVEALVGYRDSLLT